MLLKLRSLSLLVAFSSCGPAPKECLGSFVGDPGARPELQVAHLLTEGDGPRLVPLHDGDPVDLVRPVQGGHVIFVGALVRNIDGCGGSIRGELRRDQSGQPGGILVYDERSSELHPGVAETGPGWGSPAADPGEVPNVPACPNLLPDELLDVPVWLRLTYTARDGTQASGRARVVPRCRQSEEDARRACRCECAANYTIERCVIR